MATEAEIKAIRVFKNRLEACLNDWLCEMKPGYDDSIVGFNEAWDIMRKLFMEIETSRPASDHPSTRER